MEPLIQEFSDYLRIEKRNSPHTISAYRSDLIRFSSELSGKTLDSVTTANIRSFLITLRSQGLSASSVARSLSSIKSFFKYLCLDKQLKNNTVYFNYLIGTWVRLVYCQPRVLKIMGSNLTAPSKINH